MERLKIRILQTDPCWQDPEQNLHSLRKAISGCEGREDLILLPEMALTGFTMKPEGIELTPAQSQALSDFAKARDALLSGSFIVREIRGFYNRALVFGGQSGLPPYDKKHLFSPGGESKAYLRGETRVVWRVKGWRLAPFICYDLRFPEWCRNQNNYDVALFFANWPTPRVDHWISLLRARAIENQCFVVGVNRVGTDGNGLNYPGRSVVIDPWGEIIHSGSYQEEVLEAVLDPERLRTIRETYPFLRDADFSNNPTSE